MNDWIKIITDPELYVNLEIGGYSIGIYFLLFIAFSEAALFTGLLFSSDSFLFIAGIYSNVIVHQLIPVANESGSAFTLAGLIASASILGNLLAYSYGSRTERYFDSKNDSLFFKKKYLEKSKVFFEKYGGWAVISSHYIPLVRTFMPLLASVSGMKFSRFVVLVSLSSTVWSFSIVLSGHYLYTFLLNNYDFNLKQHLWLMIAVLCAVAIVFLVVNTVRKKVKKVC
ncbi:DedA family protein [Pedobacter sp. ASV28]|uniref:DedA family protein n=1 Tax=Pedobacter sp. ASV28 TaxID=2795123 RepID=UPI0018EB1E87|nr:DedA family protein [Pedobacter sp. ASV28]